MSLHATLLQLTTENARLQAELAAALVQIATLQARVATLEQQKTPPPPGVKANTPPQPPRPPPGASAGPRRTERGGARCRPTLSNTP